MSGRLDGVRVGCAMTGSFCTFSTVFDAWRALRAEGAELFPIMSFNASSLDTRFYPACKAVGIFEEIAGRKVWNRLEQVEPIGPKRLLDAGKDCGGNYGYARCAGGEIAFAQWKAGADRRVDQRRPRRERAEPRRASAEEADLLRAVSTGRLRWQAEFPGRGLCADPGFGSRSAGRAADSARFAPNLTFRRQKATGHARGSKG